MDKIKQALTNIFKKHRIVFWYDAKKELRHEFETLELPGIEKIELKNNEFGVKHHILREKPEQKFLLYHEGPQPPDLDNWLLDVLLAHGEFRTDQAGIWLSELELGIEFVKIIQTHADFFNAAKRREKLKDLIKPDDTPGMIRLKMMAVCAGAEPRVDEILENLLAEIAEGGEDKFNLIRRCNLDTFLWDQLKRNYGYDPETAGMRDFVIELFKSCYAMGTDGRIRLTGDALVFLKRWKDSIRHHKAFEILSNECADFLKIEQDLQKQDCISLLELDYFRLIDQKILSDLVQNVVERTISAGACAVVVRQRRQNHWYKDFVHLYEAVDHASQFMQVLDEVNLEMESLVEGVQRYAELWYRPDQLYRKYVYHVSRSGQTTLMQKLSDMMENLYSNTYLLTLNNNWQRIVDAASKWQAPPVTLQSRFFTDYVRPFLKNRKKVFVVISDALRFEAGQELQGLIRQEDRYWAAIEPCLSMLPSYTQMGMAALLPNKEIAISENNTGSVLVDGQNSQGTAYRNKILQKAIPQTARVLRADELLTMNKDDCRGLIRDHDVVYVYHNRIDATGDKRESEERTFEAVEETLQELIKIIKKLTAANANNLLVTADHGFIYQHRALDESDFSGSEPEGEEILFRDRRFVIGKKLLEKPGLRKFESSELGLKGDVEIQIPKSINRLRLKGSGSRFVHGGASLQEVVIPVIRINKKRKSDVSAVEVEILQGASTVITSGQVAATFYQSEPASDKVRPRFLRAGIYNPADELISDSHDLAFDLSSENPREREIKVRFVLTKKADEANGQNVTLRLEEKLGGTSHYREYKSIRYLMRRSFTSDFDF
ncbi:MAG: hypothetical protein SRB2_00063 [Desulfobacteraceae bacterium Eth-SRB2]|nr:MAG: hypothetical protein SRB2_00063 [Desulfobacteraceae bacterium Eth-SRB2]